MRPVLPGDVSAAARALLAVPASARGGLARRLVLQADAADRYRRRLGKAHPFWGNGTLMAAALGRGAARDEPRLDDPDYAECFIAVLNALLDRRQPV
ncbi:DUF7742 family protein [Tropicibacter oceani]|uniref:DUF7742 domain-containing protein n=1 Tax=Tropicibacter oceani TaxID=3058420 RepID=A0ABY8QEU8_9RHOB|nr:hypothetical protein [Tropicibacter oceani]WGW02523.1 hypothetical protein QF118_11255 [Tropicibacter oceani]